MTKKLEQAAREVIRQHSMECLSDKAVDSLREALAEQEKPLYRKVLREMLDAHEQAEQEPVHESLKIAAVALQDIACSSQTNNLLWWQIRAREAQKQITERLTNSAPAEPVKQEPVASVRWGRYKECEWTAAERLHELLGRYREGQTPLQLYAAPVCTKDLTDDEIHEAFYSKNTGLINGIRAVIAADREKNK